MKWVSTFKFIPINYSIRLAEIQDRTQRVIFDNNVRGDRMRILLSNKFSSETLRLKRMTIGVAIGNAVKTPVEIQLRGSSEIILKPGEVVYSDEISFHTEPGDRLAVSSYIAANQGIESVCGFWARGGATVELNSQGECNRWKGIRSRFFTGDLSINKGGSIFFESNVFLWLFGSTDLCG